MRAWIIIGLITFVGGCGGQEPQAPQNKVPSTNHDSPAQDSHAGHGDMKMPSVTTRKLVVGTEPSQPQAGSLTKLTLQIQGEDGTTITKFDVLHEKLVHLIVVREGLDEFAHLHPEVADSGSITIEYAFPKSGTYRLFADHQPKGESAGLAVGELVVGGSDETAAALVPNVSNEVAVGNIKAHIALTTGKQETMVRFHLVDSSGQAVSDLQPYLGAMGHLVIISADGREYVHAHPLSEAKTAPDGAVEFAAHFPTPSVYKAWGQFQRNDSIITVPFVFEHKPTDAAAHSGHHAGSHVATSNKQDDSAHGHSHTRGKMMIADAGPYHVLLTAHLAGSGNELDVFFETPDPKNPKPVAIPVESFEAQATSGEGESQTLVFEPAPAKERPAGEKVGAYSHFVAKAPWMKPEDNLLVVAKFKVDGKEYDARWKEFVPKTFAHQAE